LASAVATGVLVARYATGVAIAGAVLLNCALAVTQRCRGAVVARGATGAEVVDVVSRRTRGTVQPGPVRERVACAVATCRADRVCRGVAPVGAVGKGAQLRCASRVVACIFMRSALSAVGGTVVWGLAELALPSRPVVAARAVAPARRIGHDVGCVARAIVGDRADHFSADAACE